MFCRINYNIIHDYLFVSSVVRNQLFVLSGSSAIRFMQRTFWEKGLESQLSSLLLGGIIWYEVKLHLGPKSIMF